MNEPDDFEIREGDSDVVIAFKKSKTWMWFREKNDDPNAVINNLPLVK